MKKKIATDEGSGLITQSVHTHTSEGDERRKQIIQTAYDLIAEKGLGGLRVRDVAQRVGINNATLHYYFPTKEDLIKAIAQLLGQQFISFELTPDLPQIASDKFSPKEQMHYYFLSVAQQLHSNPERFVVATDLFIAARRDEVIRTALSSDADWQQFLMNVLEEGIRQGQFRPDLDTAQTALIIITFCKGLPLLVNTEPEEVTRLVTFMEQWFIAVAC